MTKNSVNSSNKKGVLAWLGKHLSNSSHRVPASTVLLKLFSLLQLILCLVSGSSLFQHILYQPLTKKILCFISKMISHDVGSTAKPWERSFQLKDFLLSSSINTNTAKLCYVYYFFTEAVLS